MSIGRRGFLGLLAGAAAAIPTKSYSFLGNILRPRADDVVWTSSGQIASLKNWWIFDMKSGEVLLFDGKDYLQAHGETLEGDVIAYQEMDGVIFRKDRISDIKLVDGNTLSLQFHPPMLS